MFPSFFCSSLAGRGALAAENQIVDVFFHVPSRSFPRIHASICAGGAEGAGFFDQ